VFGLLKKKNIFIRKEKELLSRPHDPGAHLLLNSGASYRQRE
jgi:hypothetical protein